MPVPGGSIEPCCNAQAAAAADGLPVVANDVARAGNDRPQVAPMPDALAPSAEAPGGIDRRLADTGYSSESHAKACFAAKIDPLIAIGRQPHHPPRVERCAAPGPASPAHDSRPPPGETCGPVSRIGSSPAVRRP